MPSDAGWAGCTGRGSPAIEGAGGGGSGERCVRKCIARGASTRRVRKPAASTSNATIKIRLRRLRLPRDRRLRRRFAIRLPRREPSNAPHPSESMKSAAARRISHPPHQNLSESYRTTIPNRTGHARTPRRQRSDRNGATENGTIEMAPSKRHAAGSSPYFRDTRPPHASLSREAVQPSRLALRLNHRVHRGVAALHQKQS